MINIGTLELADAYVGSTPIEKAYLGSTLVWEKSSPAPDYDAQVEWLATDGAAYIDTGFKPDSNTTTGQTAAQVQYCLIPNIQSVRFLLHPTS